MSSKKKTEVDDISRETQRIVSESHVRLPYHKPKQKTLKDFLNKRKISKEYQASITGSKKLLQKAWEFIENKEQNVEKFYNEDCSEVEDNEELSPSNGNIQVEKNISLDSDDDDSNCCDKGTVLKSKNNDILSEESETEDNNKDNSSLDSELSDNDAMASFNDNEEENSKEATSLCSEEPLTLQDNENLEYDLNSNNFDDSEEDILNESLGKQFIDDEAELSDEDHSSDEEDNLHNFIDESEEEVEELSKKKKRKLNLISESSDEDSYHNDKNESSTEIKLTPSDLIPLFNEPDDMSTQQLMGLCSGQFQTQESQPEEDNQDVDDDFDSEVPINEADLIDDSDDGGMKLTSAKDFFDDEAELSESDWSSDDEEHLVNVDKLEEEEGDKDKLDENIVKDGLDKIYMRQLLDDDKQQVSALKEMLLEDGELHSDSNRKRKFQWDENDENDAAFKKPLFSDNEDDNDEALSDDEKAEHWRKERFNRERYLSQNNDSGDDEEIIESEESSNSLLTPVSSVKKLHVVKYQKSESVLTPKANNLEINNESVQSNYEIQDDNNKSNSTLITAMSNDTTKKNFIESIGVIDVKVTNTFSSKTKQLVKGSFMKRKNEHKMVNALLYVNKKSLISSHSEVISKKYEETNELKSINTITANAATNPFAYLMKNDKKTESKNVMDENLMKKENICLTQPNTSVQSSQKLIPTKSRKSIKSILKQLE